MKSGDLIEFLQNRMSMSHIYQPLLIKSLIDAGGTATIRQLALQFLNQDESQIQYYENRIKQMPLKVLSKHGIVSKQSDLVSLNVQKLTLQEKSLSACFRSIGGGFFLTPGDHIEVSSQLAQSRLLHLTFSSRLQTTFLKSLSDNFCQLSWHSQRLP